VTTDFKTLLRTLADAGVEFILVGGVAATVHGSTRRRRGCPSGGTRPPSSAGSRRSARSAGDPEAPDRVARTGADTERQACAARAGRYNGALMKTKARATPEPSVTPAATPPRAPARVIPLGPERALAQAAKRFVEEPGDRCAKCDSTFVEREPAFLHCRYCGTLARIAKASLLAQEEYELRSGLRLAS
jgi:hypothetical protein